MYVGVTIHDPIRTFDECLKSTTITIIWDPVSNGYCGEALYYIVMISSNEHLNIMNDTVNVTGLMATFFNLRNNTVYNISVTPYNRAGAGMTAAVRTGIFLSPSKYIATCIIM